LPIVYMINMLFGVFKNKAFKLDVLLSKFDISLYLI
jgi:hypothetical protein